MHRVAVALVLTSAATAAASPAQPVPGTIGLARREITLRDACSPTFSLITVRKRGDDKTLVAALTWPRIGGLNFDHADPARNTASLKRFDVWFRGLTSRYQDAIAMQMKVVADDQAPRVARIEAMARVILLEEQMAATVGSLEVPRNVRKIPEAAQVYCDMLDERAAPIEGTAKDARVACAAKVSAWGVGTGWWSTICVAPAAAP